MPPTNFELKKKSFIRLSKCSMEIYRRKFSSFRKRGSFIFVCCLSGFLAKWFSPTSFFLPSLTRPLIPFNFELGCSQIDQIIMHFSFLFSPPYRGRLKEGAPLPEGDGPPPFPLLPEAGAYSGRPRRLCHLYANWRRSEDQDLTFSMKLIGLKANYNC